jgi:EmrB/QacA subfamily drug resistance transporter
MPDTRGKNSGSTQHAGSIWVLAATILGSSMVFIDGSAVNVALPVLQTDLGATVADAQWVIEGYTLFLGALILVGGSLGDRYGRRRIFGLGIILFALASVLCGLAPNPGMLILARLFQGVGGALLIPGSLSIINAVIAPDERGKAIGTWSGATSITAAIGPLLGGWLVENVSWRWVFFINVPLAVIVLLVLFTRVPENKSDEAQGKLDWLGATLCTVGLGGLVFGLIEASNRGWGDALVIGTIVGGVAALAAFVIVEARSAAPIMPLGLFRSRTFSGTNLLTLMLYGALSAVFFFVPFDLIQVQGFSPTEAGAAMLPFIILLSTLSRWSGGLINKFGAKLPLVIGPAITGVGFALFALPGTHADYWTGFFPAITVAGLGMAITVAPLTTAVMGAVDNDRSGVASGVNNAVSRVGGLVAIAVFGIVMLAVFNGSLDSKLPAVSLSAEVRQQVDTQRSKLAAIEIPSGISSSQQASLRETIDTSFVDGFRLIALMCGGLAWASALSAWALVEGKGVGEEERADHGGRDADHEDHED